MQCSPRKTLAMHGFILDQQLLLASWCFIFFSPRLKLMKTAAGLGPKLKLMKSAATAPSRWRPADIVLTCKNEAASSRFFLLNMRLYNVQCTLHIVHDCLARMYCNSYVSIQIPPLRTLWHSDTYALMHSDTQVSPWQKLSKFCVVVLFEPEICSCSLFWIFTSLACWPPGAPCTPEKPQHAFKRALWYGLPDKHVSQP